jgi:hypothetical protein
MMIVFAIMLLPWFGGLLCLLLLLLSAWQINGLFVLCNDLRHITLLALHTHTHDNDDFSPHLS